jgi:hypothetical protein
VAVIDFSTVTWREVRKWAEQRLDAARNSNDAKDLDAVSTAFLRGRINALKELVGLPEQATRQMATDPDD